MTTRFEPVATIHAPLGITNPLQWHPTLIWRGFPNGDSEAPGGPGGHALTGSIAMPSPNIRLEVSSSGNSLYLHAGGRLAADEVKGGKGKAHAGDLSLGNS